MSRDQIMKTSINILANKDVTQKVRDFNFGEEVQVKDEID